MKKIIFMLVFSLTALTATEKAKFTISNSGILDSATSKSQTNTLPTPSAEVQILSDDSTIIPNSVDQIWADMNEPNTGWVSNMNGGYHQFKGPVPTPIQGNFDSMNCWIEVEAAGNGSSCSTDINQATNTRVEIGHIRMYVKRNGKWTHPFPDMKNTKVTGKGSALPNAYVLLSRGCGLDEYDAGKHFTHLSLMQGSYAQRTNANGFFEYRPQYYYRWHAWNPGGSILPMSTFDGIYGVCYMRLVVDDPSKPDDRDKANYVAHIAGDKRLTGVQGWDNGISRYKKVTKDWVAFNFYAFKVMPTKAELEANPPPIVLEP